MGIASSQTRSQFPAKFIDLTRYNTYTTYIPTYLLYIPEGVSRVAHYGT